MKKFLAILSIVAVLGSFSAVYAMRVEDANACHAYCAKAYPQDRLLYEVCMDGCLHGRG